MFAGCSEVRIITKHVQSAIVKHVQHVGIIRASSLPGGGFTKFFNAWGDRKNCGGVVCKGGISTHADIMANIPEVV